MSNAAASPVGATSGDEPPLTASTIVAHAVGSHILRIDGYSCTKGLSKGKFISSGTFSVRGHRWCLQYYPNGAGSYYSDWISLFLRLDHTTADERGKLRAQTKQALGVLDQEGNPVPSYSRDVDTCTFSVRKGGNAVWGYDCLIRRADLERSAYLKKDVFSVRCDVTVATNQFVTKDIPVPAVRRGV
ncbi:hypothetical protein VPH35_125271 [Triticum aestivum]